MNIYICIINICVRKNKLIDYVEYVNVMYLLNFRYLIYFIIGILVYNYFVLDIINLKSCNYCVFIFFNK